MCLHTSYVYNFTLYIENTLLKNLSVIPGWCASWCYGCWSQMKKAPLRRCSFRSTGIGSSCCCSGRWLCVTNTIPSCKNLLTPSILTLLCWPQFAGQSTVHHCPHISVMWLWKSSPTIGIKTWENDQNLANSGYLKNLKNYQNQEFGLITFFATSLTRCCSGVRGDCVSVFSCGFSGLCSAFGGTWCVICGPEIRQCSQRSLVPGVGSHKRKLKCHTRP